MPVVTSPSPTEKVVVDIIAARDALRAQTPRTTELVGGITDPSVLIPDSEWTVGEAAAHLAIGAEGFSQYARGLERRYPVDLADMLQAGIEIFLDATDGRSADDPLRWHGNLALREIGPAAARLVIAGVAPIFELRVNRSGGAEIEAEYEPRECRAAGRHTPQG